eukprot:GHUV01010936.1.p1 GENE.GHUV01010936.1~~GHUV01010936.1.p1  ORF type:complete len:423 (+),score=111.92 GHUV01010936.1:1019-2287(+)
MIPLSRWAGLTATCLAPCAAAAAAYSTSALRSFQAKDVTIKQKQRSTAVELPEELPFGKVFTDHMFMAKHSTSSGWDTPRIIPFGPIELHPAAQVLHYGTTCFEGMKAYLGVDGRGRLFRPEMNMARLQRSAQRLMLADFDTKELQQCIMELLRVDRAWLPTRPGHSMYIRPFMFGSDGALGVHRSNQSTLMVILSPVGPYFKSGVDAVRLYLDIVNVRAWPGGAGQHKVGGNYAPTVQPQMSAMQQHNCSQVMYALPQGPDPSQAVISECGAMNMFFVFNRLHQTRTSTGGIITCDEYEVVTPPLDGTILPGVTRDSIVQLLKERRPDVLVSERPVTVEELYSAHQQGKLLEVFGSGTACVVQPVGCIVTSEGKELRLAAGETESSSRSDSGRPGVAGWVRQLLQDIQYGREEHPWSVPFE